MTLFFGGRWDAPIVDDGTQVPTPVGIECIECREAIVDGEQGLLLPLMLGADGTVDSAIVVQRLPATPTGQAVMTAQHRECSLLGIVGHLVEVCSCTDYAGHGARTRAAAREVDTRRRAYAQRQSQGDR